ncbi:MAG: hypothetical protein COA82_10170 [Alkaliphilus sp.]|nr:diguanylate cyclase [Alkaliphilus sp. AH-315-G20]PHS31340.1 MAG: hypothetical protein COA82_10170 [Alkaliphilus sp.]
MNKTNSINGTKKFYIEFFNNIILKYMQYSFAEIDYKSVIDDLMLLSNAKYVFINEYCREKEIMQTKAIGGFNKHYEKMIAALGFDLIGKEWTASSEDQPIIGTRKLKKYNSLSSVISDRIPEKTVKRLEKIFGAGEAYTIGFYQKDELFGNLILFSGVGEELKEQDLVEFFARLLGIVLHRRRTEEKLRSKEIELQKSNEELTLVNEELTAINEELQASMQQLLATEEELREKYYDLIRQKKIMKSLFEFSPDAVAHLSKTFHIIDVNSKFVEMFGYSKEECKNKFIDEIVCAPEQKELGKKVNKEVGQNLSVHVETQRVNRNGTIFSVLIRGGPTIVNDEIIGYHAIYTDISERKKTENYIKRLSYQDSLTKLNNRAFFEEQLVKLDTDEMHPLSIIMADINNLKFINDVFGHTEGDKLLRSFAVVLREQCRKNDIIARWGGDEFFIILPQTPAKIARRICERIKKECKNIEGTLINVSAALGYAEKDILETRFSSVIKIAEKRMYRDKLIEGKGERDRIITSLQNSLLEKNVETKEHTDRIKELSIRLGKRLKLGRVEQNKLKLLSLLHDIGKIVIADSILLKPEKLTVSEYEEIKKHPEAGYRIVQTSVDLAHIAEIVLFHHEHWDGQGYPRGIKGRKIPRLARIISIVDAYVVMTHGTVYKKAITYEEALKEISRCAGSQFDPNISEEFVEMMMEME